MLFKHLIYLSINDLLCILRFWYIMNVYPCFCQKILLHFKHENGWKSQGELATVITPVLVLSSFTVGLCMLRNHIQNVIS